MQAARSADRRHLLVAAELAAPDRPIFTGHDVAAHAGLDLAEVSELWASFGFPSVPFDHEVRFTRTDLDAFRTVADVRAATGLSRADTRALARVVGAATRQVAEAGVSGVGSANAHRDPVERAARLVDTADVTLPGVALLLDFAWRRHLTATLSRQLAAEGSRAEAMPVVTVGFADLSDFTAISNQLGPTGIETLVARFTDTVHAVVQRGSGRVVKMLGDEVMFVAEDPDAAVRIGLELVARVRAEELLSDVKVGLASGPVLARDGDYFGPPVNTASRITSLTRPGAVVITDAMHDILRPVTTHRWRNLRRCYLRDIGWIRLWAVSEPGSDRPGTAASRTASALGERVRLSLEQAAALRGPVG